MRAGIDRRSPRCEAQSCSPGPVRTPDLRPSLPAHGPPPPRPRLDRPARRPAPARDRGTTRVDPRLSASGGSRRARSAAWSGRSGEAFDVHGRRRRRDPLPALARSCRARSGRRATRERRARAWEALRPCVVIEATVGSRAWGLADERLGQGPARRVRAAVAVDDRPRRAAARLVSADGSATYWEVGKAVRQALRADPNTLEMLFVAGATRSTRSAQWILEARDAFVSQEIYGSFGRYALSQLERLEQSQRLAEHRAVVLGWLREEPAPALDEVAARLAEVAPRARPDAADAALTGEGVHQAALSIDVRSGPARRERLRALVGSRAATRPTLELPRELRPKNAYNLVRLLGVAIRWLRDGRARRSRSTGALRDRCSRSSAARCRSTEALREAEALAPELEAARSAARCRRDPTWPAPTRAAADRARRLARRWIAASAGPFGAMRRRPRRSSGTKRRPRRHDADERPVSLDAASAGGGSTRCSPRRARARRTS